MQRTDEPAGVEVADAVIGVGDVRGPGREHRLGGGDAFEVEAAVLGLQRLGSEVSAFLDQRWQRVLGQVVGHTRDGAHGGHVVAHPGQPAGDPPHRPGGVAVRLAGFLLRCGEMALGLPGAALTEVVDHRRQPDGDVAERDAHGQGLPDGEESEEEHNENSGEDASPESAVWLGICHGRSASQAGGVVISDASS